jgi:hypothetical protein
MVPYQPKYVVSNYKQIWHWKRTDQSYNLTKIWHSNKLVSGDWLDSFTLLVLLIFALPHIIIINQSIGPCPSWSLKRIRVTWFSDIKRNSTVVHRRHRQNVVQETLGKWASINTANICIHTSHLLMELTKFSAPGRLALLARLTASSRLFSCIPKFCLKIII